MIQALIKIIREAGNNIEYVGYFEDEEHLRKSIEYTSKLTLNKRIEVTPIPPRENMSYNDYLKKYYATKYK